MPVAPARTHQGDRGDAVKAWQQFLASKGFDPGAADGIHGSKTEAASVAYERSLAAPPAPASPVDSSSATVIPFMKARNFRPTGRKSVDWIVLHSTENPVRVGTAKGVARYFEGPSAPMASSHYVVGPEEVWQCVPETDIAFAAPGANEKGIQIEMVGQAALTEWSKLGPGDTAGFEVMARTARLVREICSRWNIPLDRVTSLGLLEGRRGITTHASVGEAFKRSNHVDPGMPGDKRWPWDQFLGLLKAEG